VRARRPELSRGDCSGIEPQRRGSIPAMSCDANEAEARTRRRGRRSTTWASGTFNAFGDAQNYQRQLEQEAHDKNADEE